MGKYSSDWKVESIAHTLVYHPTGHHFDIQVQEFSVLIHVSRSVVNFRFHTTDAMFSFIDGKLYSINTQMITTQCGA